MPRMLKHWDGATWQFRRLKYWDGSAWAPVALKWGETPPSMSVTWAHIALGWIADGSIITAQEPTGTGGILIVFVGAAGAGTVATPLTGDWVELGNVGSVNGLRAWVSELPNPDMTWNNSGAGQFAIMTARVQGGTLAGMLDNQHENGDWGTATLQAPTVASAPADSLGICAYYTDESAVNGPYATWNDPDMVEAIDADGEPTSTHCYGAAHQVGIPAGTWDPGTVTFGSNTVVTWFSVVIPKA